MLRSAKTTSSALRAAALAAAVASAGAGAASARADAPTRPSPSSSGQPTLEEELRSVSDVVGGIRGRRFSRVVPARTMPCSVASVRLLEIARLEGARCSPDIERAVLALGFIENEPQILPGPSDNKAQAQDEDDSHPCGLAFYDQIRKEVVVVEGRSSADERAEVLSHELSHALQDQLFDLRARLKNVPRTLSGDHDAEELAVNAAINEGEATAIELLYLWRDGAERSWIQGVALEDPLEAHAVMSSGLLAPTRGRRLAGGMRSIRRGTDVAWAQQRRLGTGCYFQALARFQYLVGATFVAEAYARGGWAAVDRLRESPPQSTAQLLHPEKYFDVAERPVAIEPSAFLPDRRARYRLLYENRLGELGTMIATEADVPGWRGDLYRVIGRNADGTALVEARSVWEDPAAALKFLGRATRWLRNMKLPTGSYDLLERRGRGVVIGSGLAADEVADFRETSWKLRASDAVATAGVAAGDEERTLGIRRRGPAGVPTCELRLLEPSERDKAAEVLRAHLDAHAAATVETDGKTFGYRRRPGGGVSYVEDRADGRIVVATAADKAAVEATRAVLERAAPVRAGGDEGRGAVVPSRGAFESKKEK